MGTSLSIENDSPHTIHVEIVFPVQAEKVLGPGEAWKTELKPSKDKEMKFLDLHLEKLAPGEKMRRQDSEGEVNLRARDAHERNYRDN